MRLPNADAATIDISKLRDHCLNMHHARGRHKARVFRASLGLTARQAERLRDAIFAALPTADARRTGEDAWGRRYSADCRVEGPSGNVVDRTLWLVPWGSDTPRLTTCYVLQ